MADLAPDAGGSLRSLRLRAMLTQAELAFQAGVGIRTIRDIEAGRVRPQPRTLRLLVEALRLSEADRALLTGSSRRDAVVPRELPRALAGFAGRERHLEELLAAVDGGAAVVAVHGMAGVGKTSLAVSIGHALAARYPDGQLFLDLHGFTASVGPRAGLDSLLTRALRSLGVDDRDLPVDVDELAVRYRSVLAGRRLLLVLDDAESAAQVEALLPGTSDSLTVATSRHDLSPLPGAYSLLLEPPPLRDAVAMLTAAVDRITEEEAVAVAERCGRLPLAMGLASARLRSRPLWRVEDLLARLDDEDWLLDELDLGHRGVSAAFRASYLELDGSHRRLLRRLGLVPGDDLDARTAAALCEVTEERATAMMESLVDVHLAETRSTGRYRLHDLVRLFATRLARAEEAEAEVDKVFRRLLGVFLHYSYKAAVHVASPSQRLLTGEATALDLGLPGFADRESAVAWFQAERDNLAATVIAAHQAGQLESAWLLATAFSAFRMHDRDGEQHLVINRTALDIARRLGDARKEAHSLADRGRHLTFAGRRDEAIGCLSRAATLKQQLGDLGGATLALRNIGILHRQSGRFQEALDVYRTALELAEAASDGTAIMHISVNMFVPLLRLGRAADAGRCLVEAERRLDAGDSYTISRIENFRGTFAREQGDPVTALSIHTACLERCRREGFLGGFTPVLIELGEDLLRLGRGAEAVTYLKQAVEHAAELAYASLERSARNDLGRALTAAGRAEEAVGQHEQAAAFAQSHQDAYELARAHHGLADAYGRQGDEAAERRHLRHAAEGYAACGVPLSGVITERLERAAVSPVRRE
ncbi:putative ATPase [Kribbella amoyensis]|uniref:Putative ATPase n=1 Tax=Kribbella amoyensis TaxID=996641 RepID=A0A561C1E1_9ACTN|nr:tetratricopeptide repeat protein [Kribbella amoyensis]TWD84870.1 putative ATPase [Kribbella amoyensis]